MLDQNRSQEKDLVDETFVDDLDSEKESLPFSSASKEPALKRIHPQQQAEREVYRQARRGQRSHHGRRGIWRLLPHIGHRRRHWLQKNAPHALVVILFLAAILYSFRGRLMQQLAMSTETDFQKASLAHSNGDYKDAISRYQAYILSHPNRSIRTTQAQYYLGCCYENIGLITEAKKAFSQVRKNYEDYLERIPPSERQRWRQSHAAPDVFAHAIYDLGRLAEKKDERENMLKYYGQLVEDFPNYVFTPLVRDKLKRFEVAQGQSNSSQNVQFESGNLNLREARQETVGGKE
jgi:TolA-binding protein